jgi:hypothetical protein
MTKSTTHMRTLSEAELDIVAGGRPDNPDNDNRQLMVSNTNRGDGTLGGSLGNVIPGLVFPDGGPYTPGRLFDWP